MFFTLIKSSFYKVAARRNPEKERRNPDGRGKKSDATPMEAPVEEKNEAVVVEKACNLLLLLETNNLTLSSA